MKTEQDSDSRNVIVVLGGGLIQESDGTWRVPRLLEGDVHAVTNDGFRVDAAAILAKTYPNAMIIVSGGTGQYKDVPGAPSVAKVIRELLLDAGVNPLRIITEENSSSTLGQLRNLPPLIEKTGANHVLLVTNEWHVPRVSTFLSEVDSLRAWKAFEVEFVGAEEFLLKMDPDAWMYTIDVARTSESMKKRLELERQGVEAIKAGAYTPKTTD